MVIVRKLKATFRGGLPVRNLMEGFAWKVLRKNTSIMTTSLSAVINTELRITTAELSSLSSAANKYMYPVGITPEGCVVGTAKLHTRFLTSTLVEFCLFTRQQQLMMIYNPRRSSGRNGLIKLIRFIIVLQFLSFHNHQLLLVQFRQLRRY